MHAFLLTIFIDILSFLYILFSAFSTAILTQRINNIHFENIIPPFSALFRRDEKARKQLAKVARYGFSAARACPAAVIRLRLKSAVFC